MPFPLSPSGKLPSSLPIPADDIYRHFHPLSLHYLSGSQQVNMRRRPHCYRDKPSTQRVVKLVGVNPGHTSDLLAFLGDPSFHETGECTAGPGHGQDPADHNDALRNAFQSAIDQVTQRFEEAQLEYQSVSDHSCERHKWKGEMIAYANVVALLEDLKSRSLLVV